MVGACIDLFIPFCLWTSIEILNISFEVSLFALSTQAIVILFSLLALYRNYRSSSKVDFNLLAAFLSILLFSYLLGQHSDWRRLISVALLFLALFASGVMSLRGKQSLMIVSLLTVGTMVAIISYVSFLTGHMEYHKDVKMTFHDNIRRLANGVAFPLFYSCSKVLDDIRKKRIASSLLWVLSMFLLGYLLLMSYSRGSILAMIVAVGAILLKLTFQNKNKTSILAVIVFLLIIIYAFEHIQVESDTMFDDASSIDRIDLWGYIFGMLTASPIRALFGVGVVDMKELLHGSVFDDYYSHSLILDYLFCFGFIGFSIFITFLWRTFKRLWKGNEYYWGLFVLAIMMYVSHGSTISIMFYAYMGLCYGASLKQVTHHN